MDRGRESSHLLSVQADWQESPVLECRLRHNPGDRSVYLQEGTMGEGCPYPPCSASMAQHRLEQPPTSLRSSASLQGLAAAGQLVPPLRVFSLTGTRNWPKSHEFYVTDATAELLGACTTDPGGI
ncbi:hypothetical protein KIL84_000334 [Mauremys mutica]|uniref:Uncharacterized protein n=1 Tax=Mauremys mutica TaxID=74926 RepID=A0A9D3XGN9_9SAUR|nr:hypothetical protein KIL84_000334 [Mauremys mutica]